MRLATIRDGERTQAVRIDGDHAVEIGAADVGEVLQRPDWQVWAAAQDGDHWTVDALDYAAVVPNPDKIVCVGLNYRSHILEMGRELPTYPTVFAKFRQTLTAPNDKILLPVVSDEVDWDAELAVVIGAQARHVSVDDEAAHIAGYSVLNDISVRDYQNRTLQWFQGKTFEGTTPVSPCLVTCDEVDGRSGTISCAVDDQTMQESDISDLLFGPNALVSYVSAIVTLEPGDIIATGTPAGVGMAREPKVSLRDGQTVVTRIAGLGEQRNVCRKEQIA